MNEDSWFALYDNDPQYLLPEAIEIELYDALELAQNALHCLEAVTENRERERQCLIGIIARLESILLTGADD